MENELYHHGVKGQHWGKRNGPPYPLYRKSAYYKKTGQRPPGYTGNKSGKGNSSSKGKIGAFWDSPEVKAEKKYNKAYRKNYIDAHNKAADAMNNGGIAKYNSDWEKKYGKIDLNNPKFNREKYEGDYMKQFNALVDKNIRSVIGDPPKKRGSIGGIDDSKSEKRKQLAKKIAIGAGVAAGLAGGALVGRKLYQRKAALGAQGVADEAKNLHKNFLKNRAAQKEATSIKEGLDKAYQNSSKAIKAERAGIINKKLSLQNEGLGLKDAKGIRAYFKRRKNAKALNEIEQRLAANTTKSSNATKNYSKKLADNAWASDEAKIRYETAKRGFERAKNREAMLKRIGNKQALASTLGLGIAGGAIGYGANKLTSRKNQNRGSIGGLSDIKRAGDTSWVRKRLKKGKIGGLTKRMTASSSDSAVTRRAKAAYNSMSDAEFRRKYSVSKAEYARRVEKYGDPYKNSPMAKLGRRLSRRRRRR